jgi:hypothetical protein
VHCKIVMPALVAGIHVLLRGMKPWMAGSNNKPGHDGNSHKETCR